MAKRAFWGVAAGGVAAAALAATVGLTGPASAQAVGGQAVSATAVQAAAARSADRPKYCDRIDKALDRRQRFQTRLDGDANTRGSIAWLQAKAAATQADNPELSTLLSDLANLRTQIKGPAGTIVADLQAVQQAHCS